jgi:hypothetical protein
MQPDLMLKNLARGGKTYHGHRREIVRALFERNLGVSDLNEYLRDSLFKVRPGWRAFSFAQKDWDVADRLLLRQRSETDHQMVDIVIAYVAANLASVVRLYALGDTITGQMLSIADQLIKVPSESITTEEWQSLFGFRILCATNEQSSESIAAALKSVMVPNEWSRSRLLYPMMNQTVNGTHPEAIERFLDYFTFGGERSSERAALKLLLHHDAARSTPLTFKLFVGMMGHPFDACEILIDHLEFALARDGKLDQLALYALERLAVLLPQSRAKDIADLIKPIVSAEGARRLADRLGRYGLGDREREILSGFASLAPFEAITDSQPKMPIKILAVMRANPYPEPDQFGRMRAYVSVWGFVDGGRLIGALVRSLYLFDRTGHELEGRDVLRLISLYGCLNAYIATAPSAVPVLRRMMPAIVADHIELKTYECRAEQELRNVASEQRLWINRLQWRLRALEEAGRTQQWLNTVREETNLRPLFLTGINWPWVEEVFGQSRLKAFRSFHGAYLLLIAELELRGDPQRLKLVLDKLLRGKAAPEVVDTLIGEYGEFAPAFVTRYLTTANLLTSGRANNYFAALTQRIESLERCIRHLGYNSTLPQEMYEGETRVLTTELLLLNVNAGKFEVPWDLFVNDAKEKYRDEWEAFASLRQARSDEALSSFIERPRLFRNGHKEDYRYRRNDVLLFELVVNLVEDFADHPAFGLEIILSGRFRHNNLLQEVYIAIATVSTSTIHPVVPVNTRKLANAYRKVVERSLSKWCSRRLQTRRKDKPDALFDLIPNSDEVIGIIRTIEGRTELGDLITVVVDFIKGKLRPQLEEAGKSFVQDMRQDFETEFAQLLNEQISKCDNTYRPEDARRIHSAVLDAVLRRVESLQAWFDGVDARSVAPVSLAQLAQVTETLFENVLPDHELKTDADLEAAAATFEPAEVKVAFDLVREIAFNALKHSSDTKVLLRIRRLERPGPATFVFSNVNVDGNDSGQVCGKRYVSEDEALRREGNSGRLKIAASAATLLGKDVVVKWTNIDGRYELTVPVRPEADKAEFR